MTLKNIISIRDMLVTRTFILTFQHTIADDLAVDTTYNIINPIFDSGELLMSNPLHILQNPKELKILINDADALKFWFSMAMFLGSIYYINNQHLVHNLDSDSLDRLKKFIPYDKIRRGTSFAITLIVFVFMKNVMPVT